MMISSAASARLLARLPCLQTLAEWQAGSQAASLQAQARAGISSSSTSSSTSSSGGGGEDADSSGASTSAPTRAPTRWQDFFPRPGRRRARPDAWRERLPRKGAGYGRPAVLLRARDPARFERMRLVLGYYDLPENAHLPRPPPPATATVNQLQTLFFTDDVDAYYKLSLLSYRTKQANKELVGPALAAAGALADRLEGAAAAFAPAVPADEGGGSAGGSVSGSGSSGGGGGGDGQP